VSVRGVHLVYPSPVFPRSRERPQASDFNAALHEHVQYLRRKREAEAMRQNYSGDGGEESGQAHVNYSLKPGETIHLNLKPVRSAELFKDVRSCCSSFKGLELPQSLIPTY
jgi:Protein of unknown function (DUF1681)